MNSPVLRSTVFLCAALLASSFTGARTGGVRVDVDARSFSDPGRPGLLRAAIEWGEIRVTGHDGDDVRVAAEVTGDPAVAMVPDALRERMDLVLEEKNNVMDLRVTSRIAGFYGVDLALEVPRSTVLDLEVKKGGDIFVTDVDGEIDLSNRNGSVKMTGLGGAAVVSARNGSIVASFNRVDAQQPMSFSTFNGSVDVTFPPDTAADLRVRYNRGGVESDFPIASLTDPGAAVELDLDGLDARGTRLLRGRINGGGAPYYFHTANGTIYLRAGTR